MSRRRYGRRRTEPPGNWFNSGSGAPDARCDRRDCRAGLRGRPCLRANAHDPAWGHSGRAAGRRAERGAGARCDRRGLHAARDDRLRQRRDPRPTGPDRGRHRRQRSSRLGARCDAEQPHRAPRHVLTRPGGSDRRRPCRAHRPPRDRRSGDRRDLGRPGVHAREGRRRRRRDGDANRARPAPERAERARRCG